MAWIISTSMSARVEFGFSVTAHRSAFIAGISVVNLGLVILVRDMA